MLKIDVITLFPEMITQALGFSIPARAQKAGKMEITAHQLRDWAIDKHGTVDDTPYGGGPGMVMRVDVAARAFEAIDPTHQAVRIMLTPDGEQLTQPIIKDLAQKERIILLCGRYEGFDARIETLVDRKISVGTYVLSGGELPSLTIIDAVTRLIPGVLGNEQSLYEETFEQNSKEYPQYTRPEDFNGQIVPEILLSGHHAEIQKWQQQNRKNLS